MRKSAFRTISRKINRQLKNLKILSCNEMSKQRIRRVIASEFREYRASLCVIFFIGHSPRFTKIEREKEREISIHLHSI